MYLISKHLFKAFPDAKGKKTHNVIKDVSITIHEGECIGILGRSGCGKTTLLRMLSGLLKPDEGEIGAYNQKNRLSEYPVAFVFQEPYLLPWRSVRDNIKLAYQMSKSKCFPEEELSNLLECIGLKDSAWKYPHEISGGMESRCALARALAVKSNFLFMDEPFGNLDVGTRFELQIVVKEAIIRERRCAILVTHSIEEAIFLCNKIYVFRHFCGGIKNKDYLEIDNDLSQSISNPSKIRGNPQYLGLIDKILSFLE